ncbi:radical SAM family heme chaperone HemW [Sphingosinicella microcystinivorans]|uniref:Heme chaperone HemW n=1 Tax=Sphingosinicella microcystinivorans TaxID=335406 RepID=A0AAD1D4X2_SPHMI|nr:radical SAM family heme chaperone HemW [Sphingosinicella microcystinivorans]RKS90958.1 oxygen-independent coproporphyrinogen-3 oxidase [Sphingosinicella microcystinivorans]BBE33878.1 coproporphyrinogen III oxidase [Sphingosinicella microcystinivorans]
MSPVADPLALYVHWPFCVSKCPYCDFNSHVRERIDEAAWRDALIADMEYEARLTPGRRLSSLFFGGGTPSLMSPETVGAIIAAADRLWGFDNAEITLEANPSSVEAGRFAGFAAAGVNRVSLGLQALDDTALKALGRAHDLAEGLAALDVAQRHFPRVSFDLIYAREGQTPEEWEAELRRALAFGTEHLSLYQLTIEPGTAFATRARLGRLTLPEEDASLGMFEMTRAMTAAAGLPAYEVSNHARPGAESRHNLTYWRYGDYVGVGPGAHGRRGGMATTRERLPETWLKTPVASETPLEANTRANEALMMGLRLLEGIDETAFAARTGVALDTGISTAGLAETTRLGLVARENDRLRLTEAGQPLLNAVIARLMA